MKKYLLILVLFTVLCQVNSQDYDLIVKSDGDSIACRIDSITDTHIYFEMKSKKYWKHTHINRADVIEFKRNVINKNTVVFRLGTSYIKSPRKEPALMQDLPRNSIYIEAIGVGIAHSINYDRIIPISKKTGIVLRVGLNYKYYPIGEAGVFIGGPINCFEFGYGRTLYYWNYPMVRIGYRYQGPKGWKIKLLIRAAYFYMLSGYRDFVGWIPRASYSDTGSWAGLSVGFSF
jgi:hypothetical protein